MDANGGGQTRLLARAGNDTAPTWSSSGARVVFQGVDTDGDWEIYRIAASGAGLVKISNNNRGDVAPGW